MIRWYWDKFMQHIGYRKVWYFPTHHMCGLADFWQWEYRPDLPRGQKHTKSAEWVSLTDEEVWEAIDDVLEGGGWLDVARGNYGVLAFAKAIEQALKEKNHG